MTTVLPLRGLKLGVRVMLFVSAIGLLLCGALAQQIPLFGPPKTAEAGCGAHSQTGATDGNSAESSSGRRRTTSRYISRWANNALTFGFTRKSLLILRSPRANERE